MYFARTERRTRPIPLTPLIDVVFLLIIFFMLSTTFIRIEAMELGLPGKGDGKSAAAGKAPLLIDIAGNGGVYWQRELVLPTTLRTKLEEELGRDANRKVLVRSGKDITVQKLVSVLDIVYLAGVKDVAVDKWSERDLPVAVTEEAMEKEGKALQKAIDQEDKDTPVLKQEEVDTLPKAPASAQEQFDDIIESMP